MPAAAARSCSCSVSTLPNTMSPCFWLACSYTGAKRRHGPHHSAQKSTSTIPPSATVCANVSLAKDTIAMSYLLGSQSRQHTPGGYLLGAQRCRGSYTLPGTLAELTAL